MGQRSSSLVGCGEQSVRAAGAGRPGKWTHYAYTALSCVCVTGMGLCGDPTHQGGSCCLGRCRGQVGQHLFHLGQLFSTDVVWIW